MNNTLKKKNANIWSINNYMTATEQNHRYAPTCHLQFFSDVIGELLLHFPGVACTIQESDFTSEKTNSHQLKTDAS